LRTINKIGITGFSDKNLLDVFDLYDVDGSGELDYKEFVGGVYGNNSISKKSDVQGRVEVVQQENRGSKKVFLEQAE
jgi:Ca2+-binding EF-hand superfamily protein